MKRDDLINLCRKAHDVGKVRHEDFVDYVISLERKRRVGDEWISTEAAYMSVDGKLAMANEDHRLQGKRLDFEDPIVLFNNDEYLTLMITVVSEIYGRRHGIATSHKIGGSLVERDYPWEIAETSAIGRALSAMGYGLLPGAGLASAEDMERSQSRETPAQATPQRQVAARGKGAAVTEFWIYAKERGVPRNDAYAIISEADNDFEEALKALRQKYP